MSEAKPRRKFWRFHLSTAVTLVLVAGLMSRVNLMDRNPDGMPNLYGWPMIAKMKGFVDPINPQPLYLEWFPTGIVVDSLVSVGILSAVAVASEFLIRRREARKT